MLAATVAAWGAEEPAAAATAAWRANWLGTPTPAEPNQWTCYRKTFRLAEVPAHAPARIACDSKYWLWVNGKQVVFEGQLKRGPNRHDSYFDTVDLAPHLVAGDNTLAVLVWFWGKHGFSHNSSGRSGLLFEADCGATEVVSDPSWKSLRHPAYGGTAPPHPNFRLAEPNIRFDAAKDLPGWTSPGFDDSRWDIPVVAGPPPAGPWGALHPRPIPQWRDSGLLEYPAVERQPLADGATKWTARLPYNAQVTPWLELTAPAGLVVDIRTDHFTGGGHPNVRAEYVTREGLQSHESPGWMNGHHVIYTIPKGAEVKALKYRETGYDADRAGRFHCDDAALNTLWEKAARTLQVNMRDTFFDCPDRERAQWVGDAVIEFHQVYYLFDARRGPQLVRKAFHEVIDWRRDDGVIYGPVPAGWPGDRADRTVRADLLGGAWDRELPMQMLAFASEPSLWCYYLHTGDRATIVKALPVIRDYLGLWEPDARGLVKHRAGDWDWPDWGDNHDVLPLENAWYYSALACAAKMARLAGRDGELPWIEQRMRGIAAAYDQAFWRGDRYHDPAYRGDTDDRANAMAVVAGLAGGDKHPALRRLFLTQKHASPYMERFVLDALCRMGAADQAITRIKERWAPQLDNGLTTLYEGWGAGAKGYGGGTVNHAWSGGMLTVLGEWIAGITPVEPGWSRFRVRPMPGMLREIDTTVPTPHGEIVLAVRADGGTVVIELTVPAGTAAVVDPGGCGGTIRAGASAGQDLGPGRHRVVIARGELPGSPIGGGA